MDKQDHNKGLGPHAAPAATLATALSRAKHGETAGQIAVLAQASGVNTALMLDLAQRHQIPVVQDFTLSKALSRMPQGTLIPDDVFQAVATLLDFIVQQESVMETRLRKTEQ